MRFGFTPTATVHAATVDFSKLPQLITQTNNVKGMTAAVENGTTPSLGQDTRPDLAIPTYEFAFSDFLKREYRFGLDPSRPVCKAFREGHCPLGTNCPDKHQVNHSFNSLVCKHWLRGLCKKGDQCEYLHEYNLRRMPECNQYARTLYCSSGDDCLFLHVPPSSKLPPCPHYERGHCPLGPICSKKHVRKSNICKFYLVGFCPYGPACKEGAHPRFPSDLPKPTVRVEKSAEEMEDDLLRAKEEAEREEEREWERNRGDRRDGRARGKGRFGGARRRGAYDR
ncbi:MAG: hypothetical protein LQ352_002970 [Teloschistes flavicans]|nr:MAG: hypothetical protein LQ352_002970 [Teloschistes flavicans]